MKEELEYNVINDADFELIIEPGPYYYPFKSEDNISVVIEFSSEKKFNKEDVSIGEDRGAIIFWINKIGIPCRVKVKKENEIIDEFDFI